MILYLCSRFEFLNAITLSLKQNLFFTFHDYYKKFRIDANHFSNEAFVLFQNKFSQSRYEVSVILPAFLLGRVDLRIVADDVSKIAKP